MPMAISDMRSDAMRRQALILLFRPLLEVKLIYGLHLVAPWQPGSNRRAACVASSMIRPNLFLKVREQNAAISVVFCLRRSYGAR
jgi:hypothetical protein